MPYIPIQEAREKDSATKRFLYSLAEAGGQALVQLPAKIIGGVIEEGTKQLFGAGGKWRGAFQSDSQVSAEKTQVSQTLEQQRVQTRGLRAGAVLAEEQGRQVRPDSETRRANDTTQTMAVWRNANTAQSQAASQAALGAAELNLRAAMEQARAEQEALEFAYRTRPRAGGSGFSPYRRLESLAKQNKVLKDHYGAVINTVQTDAALNEKQKEAAISVFNGNPAALAELPAEQRKALLLKYPTLSDAAKTYAAYKQQTEIDLQRNGYGYLVETLNDENVKMNEPTAGAIDNTETKSTSPTWMGTLGGAVKNASAGAIDWIRATSRSAQQTETDYSNVVADQRRIEADIRDVEDKLAKARAGRPTTPSGKQATAATIKTTETRLEELRAKLGETKELREELEARRKQLRAP